MLLYSQRVPPRQAVLTLVRGMLLTMDLLSCFKEELEAMASRSEANSTPNDRQVHCSPFELWEIRLELVYVASYSGNADSSIVRETRGLDSSIKLSRGRWYCMPKCLRGLVLTFSRATTHPASSSREGCCMHRLIFISYGEGFAIYLEIRLIMGIYINPMFGVQRTEKEHRLIGLPFSFAPTEILKTISVIYFVGLFKKKMERTFHAKYIIQKVLPFLQKMDTAQRKERDLEKKIQGVSKCSDNIKTAEYGHRDLYCSLCSISIPDYHRGCTTCPYVLCLYCCNDLRAGNIRLGAHRMPIKYVDYGLEYRHGGVKKIGKVSVGGIKVLRRHTLIDKDPAKHVEPSLRWVCDENGAIPCPPKDRGGCGESTLELRGLFCGDAISKLIEEAREYNELPSSIEGNSCPKGSEGPNEESSNQYSVYSPNFKQTEDMTREDLMDLMDPIQICHGGVENAEGEMQRSENFEVLGDLGGDAAEGVGVEGGNGGGNDAGGRVYRSDCYGGDGG